MKQSSLFALDSYSYFNPQILHSFNPLFMRPIIYYVATSLDGYISGPDEDISGFVPSGDGVDQYLRDLQDFKVTIMGRKTYEFGYKYGLEPGQPAYAHMEHYILSDSLKLDNLHPQVKICPVDLSLIKDLKAKSGKPIYLCGGGQFAGWLLANELIDILKIKLNPLILGGGVPLFGGTTKQYQLELLEKQGFEKGLQILTYQIKY